MGKGATGDRKKYMDGIIFLMQILMSDEWIIIAGQLIKLPKLPILSDHYY